MRFVRVLSRWTTRPERHRSVNGDIVPDPYYIYIYMSSFILLLHLPNRRETPAIMNTYFSGQKLKGAKAT